MSLLTRNSARAIGWNRCSTGFALCHPNKILEVLKIGLGFQACSRSMASSLSSPQDELKSGIDPSQSSESAAEGPPATKGVDTNTSSTSSTSNQSPKSSSKATKQKYPLYPSVAQLLHVKGIPSSEADSIPATGPKGRLLKGDVLAYLGAISSSYASDQSARISKLAHLDLSNIQVATPKKANETSAPINASAVTAPTTPVPEPETEVSVKISLKAVRELQDHLGTGITFSMMVDHAAREANRKLPRPPNSPPTANELFNQIVGSDSGRYRFVHGNYKPEIRSLPIKSAPSKGRTRGAKEPDIIDQLTRARPFSRAPLQRIHDSVPEPTPGTEHAETVKVLSVSAKKDAEHQARVFLDRIRTILELEPISVLTRLNGQADR